LATHRKDAIIPYGKAIGKMVKGGKSEGRSGREIDHAHAMTARTQFETEHFFQAGVP
jgi:hypothetical protein